MLEMLFGVTTLVVLLAGVLVVSRLHQLSTAQREVLETLTQDLETKHREMLNDLHQGMSKQSEAMQQGLVQHGGLLNDAVNRNSDRLRDSMSESFERLRASVGNEMKESRETISRLQTVQSEALSTLRLTLVASLGESREQMLKQLGDISAALQNKQDTLREDMLLKLSTMLAEQSKREMEQLQAALQQSAASLAGSVAELTKATDNRLAEISGKVTERLDEGFKKTNETFASVMARLATIDEAQKKIDGLTTNVVSLQELLGDKRSRGAFGEVQLEHLISNVLPAQTYELQAALAGGVRVDCLLKLPEPTGTVAVDSKFPLENYHRMFAGEMDKLTATRLFKADVKKHVDDIANKYIIPNVTADGAVMFVPAEAVFAEIHAYHPELVQYAMGKRVWIVSPTTLMAVLNTARAVIKDVETRKQVHIIKDALGKLGQEFGRFDKRMKNLATHIRQAHEDAMEVSVTSEKISKQFINIEQVRLEGEEPVLIAAGTT
ncbi:MULTISPECIES: DNA recombination protein RmuC [Deefgea]|uniref:DNA recombination protein RmuC n=1 Tax=Deefgea chitinilytica TaxID=570276 RepID=A0ABS2C989_9NEIS|nr:MULTISPECIES: DNA recombination protein RmuC [Deefgea]MBM5570704.1 DNA recombination protein RmuC [Deefgea chitinilytica]MBM9887933.1 DNA recombination protein RmuC [Deefgea sp. CFH1-16]